MKITSKFTLLLIMLTVISITCSCAVIGQPDEIADNTPSTEEGSQDQQTTQADGPGDKPGTEDDDGSTASPEDDLSDIIRVDSPVPGQLITSPLVIEGEARGTWFFEASFPLRLLDADGNVLVEHYAQTEEEWMTEDFISFTSQIEFAVPETDTGILLLIKDNPSDIREYDAQIEIPVRFR